jgi:hypothetical protein
MWRLIIGVLLILFVMQAALLASARVMYSDDLYDPLAPFAAVMPGQPMEAAPLWCPAYEEYYEQNVPEDLRRVCIIASSEWTFHTVHIYAVEDAIRSLTFQANGLSIGDLSRSWGTPVIESETPSYRYARWERGDYTVTVPIGNKRFSYWLPADSLFVEVEQQAAEL